MLGFILVMLLVGLIAGFVARALVPGRDPMGVLGTIVLGIAGSLLGGFLWNALFVEGDQDGFQPAGIIGSIIGAIIVLLIWRAVDSRSHTRRGMRV